MSAQATQQAHIVSCPNCGTRNRVPAVGESPPKCGNCHRPLPWIADAGDDDFGDVAERSPVPALVDLWAVWCGPCRMVSPVLERLAGERAGTLKLVKVDVDGAPRLSQRFGIQAVPTLMVLRNGEILARRAGAAPEAALRDWLESGLTGTGGEQR